MKDVNLADSRRVCKTHVLVTEIVDDDTCKVVCFNPIIHKVEVNLDTDEIIDEFEESTRDLSPKEERQATRNIQKARSLTPGKKGHTRAIDNLEELLGMTEEQVSKLINRKRKAWDRRPVAEPVMTVPFPKDHFLAIVDYMPNITGTTIAEKFDQYRGSGLFFLEKSFMP